MNKKTEQVLRIAIDKWANNFTHERHQNHAETRFWLAQYKMAFNSLLNTCKEALDTEQVREDFPAQEPVADYVIIDGLKYPAMVEVMAIHDERGKQTEDNCDCINAFLPQGTKLYTHPAPAQDFFERGKEIAKWADKRNKQPAQEPVAWRSEGGILTEAKLQAQSWISHGGKAIPLYTHPAPAREPLSEDEIASVIQKTFPVNTGVTNVDVKLVRAIEKEHGIGG